MIKIYNDDCLKVLSEIEDESIDLVVTDCPYKIVSGGCTNENKVFKPCSGMLNKRKDNEDEEEMDNIRKGKIFKHNDINFKDWLPSIYRVLKQNTHCYIMINPRNLKELQEEAEKVGFTFQQIIIWNKGNAVPNRYYMNAYEMILMLRKGKAKTINCKGTKNILDVPNIIGNKKHPTEKPVELMEILINNSSSEGDIILDPFMGAGATGVACKNNNRSFIGVEIDEKYFEIAQERLKM